MFTERLEVLQIYRLFSCELQEFYLKLDKGFLFSLKDWYDATIITKTFTDQVDSKTDNKVTLMHVSTNQELIDWMQEDQKLTKEIMEYHSPSGDVKQSANIRFDNLYISPIVFSQSFSVNGTAHTDDKPKERGTSDTLLNFFLESIGATITEFKDVKFSFEPLVIA